MLTIPQEIKDILHLDSAYKNIRIHFPNGERSDICNDLIVKDSVSFTESLCSQNTLKFGLCESPVFECEVVGVGNIKGATIEVYCEVECDPAVEDSVFRNDLQKYVYPIPYGVFVVQECKRQADMQHRKIVAYNLLAINNFTLNSFEQSKAMFPNTNNDLFIQDVASLLTETLQSNLFGSTETEIATLDSGYSIQRATSQTTTYITWRFAGIRLTTADSSKLYHITCDREDYNKNHIQYARRRPNATPVSPFSGGRAPISGFEFIYPYMSMTNSSDNSTFFATNKQDNEGLYIWAIYKYSYTVTNSIGQIIEEYEEDYCDYSDIHFYTVQSPFNFSYSWERELIEGSTKYSVPDAKNIGLRELLEDFVELLGLFAGIDRFGKYYELDIKRQFELTPDDDLYPGSGVYPQGVTGGKLLPEDYQTCWYNDEYMVPFGKIECQYKNTNNIDCIYEHYFGGFTKDSDLSSYQTYFLNDNVIVKTALWTEGNIQNICQVIASHLEGVTYMPVDFVGRGLPYVEAGDTFEILTKSNESITTIVLNRTLTGEQTLTDSYKSV